MNASFFDEFSPVAVSTNVHECVYTENVVDDELGDDYSRTLVISFEETNDDFIISISGLKIDGWKSGQYQSYSWGTWEEIASFKDFCDDDDNYARIVASLKESEDVGESEERSALEDELYATLEALEEWFVENTSFMLRQRVEDFKSDFKLNRIQYEE